MQTGPVIDIDLDKIERNAQAVVTQCAEHGIDVVGVTKVTCGMPHVARAMLRGGVKMLGESRLENVTRLRDAGIAAPIMLLRIPPVTSAREVVELVDVSLNSELRVLKALGEAAVECGRVHEVVIMVDLGDLREGVWPDELPGFIDRAIEIEGIRLIGLGTNLSCYGGVEPSRENMEKLVAATEQIEAGHGIELRVISGGNSSALPMMSRGELPPRVNQLRIGEAILLGRETLGRTPWPDTCQDAFKVKAEVIELKKKPSVPIGNVAQDAFGNTAEFEDRGLRLRAILNAGREDVLIGGLTPVLPRIGILGASSDHMILDVSDCSENFGVGDEIAFIPDYGALLAAMTSGYVRKCPRTAHRVSTDRHALSVMAPMAPEFLAQTGLAASLAELGMEVHPCAIPPLPVEEEFEDLRAAAEYALQLAPMIGRELDKGTPLLFGDNEVQRLAMFMALRKCRPEYGVIVFDAHANFHTPSGRGQQCPGRMVMAAAMGHGIEGLDLPFPLIDGENTVLIGVRQVAPEEEALLARSRITVFTMEDVDSMGIRSVIEEAVFIASRGAPAVHVSLDMDVLDPEQAPGLRMPVLGGLTSREAHLCMETIARRRVLGSLDVLPIRLVAGGDPRMAQAAATFTLSALGKRIIARR